MCRSGDHREQVRLLFLPLKLLTDGKRQDRADQEVRAVSETESGSLAAAAPEALLGRQLLGLKKESPMPLGGKERLGGLWKCLTQDWR